ncbi:hypothetical protein GGG16DRAFT_30950, partial [Schizophyllum commune]
CGACLFLRDAGEHYIEAEEEAHEYQHCPNQVRRSHYYDLIRNVHYRFYVCYKCHYSPMGGNALHPDLQKGPHPCPNLVMPLAWAVYTSRYRRLAEEEFEVAAKGHNWNTVDGLREWFEDQEA